MKDERRELLNTIVDFIESHAGILDVKTAMMQIGRVVKHPERFSSMVCTILFIENRSDLFDWWIDSAAPEDRAWVTVQVGLALIKSDEKV